MIGIIVALLAVTVVIVVITEFVNWDSTVRAKEFYSKLPTLEFRKLGERMVVAKNSPFIWFVDDGDFKVDDDEYLFKGFSRVTLVHAYWRKKYENWCKENVKCC